MRTAIANRVGELGRKSGRYKKKWAMSQLHSDFRREGNPCHRHGESSTCFSHSWKNCCVVAMINNMVMFLSHQWKQLCSLASVYKARKSILSLDFFFFFKWGGRGRGRRWDSLLSTEPDSDSQPWDQMTWAETQESDTICCTTQVPLNLEMLWLQ